MTAKDAEATIIALAVTLILVPSVGLACRRFGILDYPGPLKIHTRPVPRLGGIAIAVAIGAGILAARVILFKQWPVLAAFALLWLVGLIDDLHGLPPLIRLGAQVLSGLFLWRAGFGVPVGNAALSLLATSLLVVLCVNAWNFWDGADGLAAGVAGIAALVFFLQPTRAGSSLGDLACILAGTCAGFLIFNFPRARALTFLGDSGSTLLGLALALLTLDFYRSNDASLSVVLFPFLVAALPLLDATFAVIRRVRRSRSPLRGDRRHIYDLAFARGWPPRKVALACYGVTLLFAAVGSLAMRSRSALVLPIGAVATIAFIIMAVRLGCLRTEETIPARGKSKFKLKGIRSSQGAA